MYFYIGFEDLVPNALITALHKHNKRFLTYSEINKYGSAVLKYLNNDQNKAGIVLTDGGPNDFLKTYSEYFEEKNTAGLLGISIKENVEIEKLVKEFRGYLALDVLLAFISKESVKAIADSNMCQVKSRLRKISWGTSDPQKANVNSDTSEVKSLLHFNCRGTSDPRKGQIKVFNPTLSMDKTIIASHPK